jgi:uncharacterized protein
MDVPARPSPHLDPHSEFVLDTRDLGRRAGSMREVRRSVTAPADWALELVRVPAGDAVQLDLRLESVMDGVLVSGTVTAPVAAECGRCLDPISSELAAPVQELFSYEPDPDDDEAPVVDGDLLDLEAVLRDAVVLALPLNPVCDEECPGLCPGCGIRLADAEPGHRHEEIDPRWEALAALSASESPRSADSDDNGKTSAADAPRRPADPKTQES